MAGLLQTVAGGALAGVGQGIVANAAALRQEKLEAMRQSRADRRTQLTIDARKGESEADRTARAEQSRLDREATAAEGKATRESAERRTAMTTGATRDAATARAKAAHEKWLNKPVKVGETMGTDGTSSYVYKTNRELLADIAQGKVDEARNALRDEIAAAADDQNSMFNWFSSKDNATDAEIEKAFALREKDPSLTAEQALDKAMGGRFLGGGGSSGAGGQAPPATAGTPPPSGGSVKQLPGQGTMEAPFQAASQADVDLFKRTAPKGAYIRLPDGKVARKP